MVQPKVEARKAQVITVAGLKFRDLNKNGTLDRYEDWRLPVDQRVADLVAKMTVEEKAGLMIHSSLSGFTGPNGEVLGLPAAGGRGGAGRGGATGAPANRAFQGGANPNNVEPMGSANPTQLITERHIRYILVRPNAGESPDITAKFHNGLQEMAEASRLGIPIVFSTDPRHGVGRGGPGGAAAGARPRRLPGRRSRSGPTSSGSPSRVIRSRCASSGGSRPRSCGRSASSACSGRWPT